MTSTASLSIAETESGFSLRHLPKNVCPLLISTAGEDDPRWNEMKQKLADLKQAFASRGIMTIILSGDFGQAEKDLAISRSETDRIRTRYGLERSGFAAVLVGADGAPRITRRGPIDPGLLLEMIDQLPEHQRKFRMKQAASV